MGSGRGLGRTSFLAGCGNAGREQQSARTKPKYKVSTGDGILRHVQLQINIVRRAHTSRARRPDSTTIFRLDTQATALRIIGCWSQTTISAANKEQQMVAGRIYLS